VAEIRIDDRKPGKVPDLASAKNCATGTMLAWSRTASPRKR
jgi:hypothetical protein